MECNNQIFAHCKAEVGIFIYIIQVLNTNVYGKDTYAQINYIRTEKYIYMHYRISTTKNQHNVV